MEPCGTPHVIVEVPDVKLSTDTGGPLGGVKPTQFRGALINQVNFYLIGLNSKTGSLDFKG